MHHKKGVKKSMWISKLLFITIPFILVTCFHVAATFGMDVPAYLTSPAIGLALISVGVVFALLGMKVGLAVPFIIAALILVFGVYLHWQYELDILFIQNQLINRILLSGIL